MFGMCQRFELPEAVSSPVVEAPLFTPGLLSNAHKEFWLGQASLRLQPCGFPSCLNNRQVYVGGKVLFAGIVKHIARRLVPAIGAQCAVMAPWRKKLPGCQTIVQCQQFATVEQRRRLVPPVGGSRADFRGEAIGKNGKQFGWSVDRQSEIVNWLWQSCPDESATVQSHAPLELLAPLSVPPEAMNRHGVKKFVREDHATKLASRGRRRAKEEWLDRIGLQISKAGEPTHFVAKFCESLPLPFLASI